MNYTEIFDFESKKLLELFILLNNEEQVFTIDEISHKLKIDPKTSLKYIKKLQALIEQFQLSKHLAIYYEEKKQVTLYKENKFYPEYFKTSYLNRLPEVIFLKAVIEEKKIVIEQFATKFLISESNLRRKIRRINNWLLSMHLHLKRGSYELVGEEQQIRAFIFRFYWVVDSSTKAHCVHQFSCKLETITEKILHFFNLQINDLQKECILKMIQITHWRYIKNHHITFKQKWLQYIQESKKFSRFLKFQWDDEVAFTQDYTELSYLYLLIQARFLPCYGKKEQNCIIQEHFKKKTSCYQTTLVVTDTIKQIFWEKEFEYTQESLAAFLSFHLYYELEATFSFEYELSMATLKRNYPVFSQKLKDCLKKLSVSNSELKKIPKNSQITRYFLIVTSLIMPTWYEKRIVICIMTDFSIEQELEIGNRIMYFFYSKANITIIYARTSKSILYANVILTTKAHQTILSNYKGAVILLDSTFSKNMFLEIERKIMN